MTSQIPLYQMPLPGPVVDGMGTARRGQRTPLRAARMRYRTARRRRTRRTPPVLQPGVLPEMAQRQPLRRWRAAGRR